MQIPGDFGRAQVLPCITLSLFILISAPRVVRVQLKDLTWSRTSGLLSMPHLVPTDFSAAFWVRPFDRSLCTHNLHHARLSVQLPLKRGSGMHPTNIL